MCWLVWEFDLRCSALSVETRSLPSLAPTFVALPSMSRVHALHSAFAAKVFTTSSQKWQRGRQNTLCSPWALRLKAALIHDRARGMGELLRDRRLVRRRVDRITVYEEILTEERFATENKEIVREAESNK